MHDTTIFASTAVEQPSWEPLLAKKLVNSVEPIRPSESIYVFDDAVDPVGCKSLIGQFAKQVVYPVGVDGYCNDVEHAGSFRAMGWSPKLASTLHQVFRALPQVIRNGHDGTLTSEGFASSGAPFRDEEEYYTLLGSTPWMRFMRYPSGGMHVPHYDASFFQAEESYRTLFSWVLYLTDCEPEQGGRFQFIDDAGDHNEYKDWTHMAQPSQVQMSVRPKAGRLIVFPHWLCHQVEQFTGTVDNPLRIMIRGDVAYGY